MTATLPRNAMSARMPALVLAGVAWLAGCSSPGGVSPHAQPPTTPTWSAEEPATISGQHCPGGGDCAFGFLFDDVFVEVNCRGITEGVTDRVIAIGADGVPVREARAVSGVSSRLLVAVRNTADVCGGDADWVAGIVGSGERSIEDELALSTAACEVTGAPYTYPYRDTQDCDEGGPARARFEGPDGRFGEEFAWFPSVVAETNRALQAGEGPDFRRDPAAVIAAFEQWAFPDCFADDPASHLQVCRIGRGDLSPDAETSVVVSGVTQARNADIGFESESFEWTVEQLGGGPGWWITRKTYQPMSRLSDDEADRTWEQCCTEVITNIDDRTRRG